MMISKIAVLGLTAVAILALGPTPATSQAAQHAPSPAESTMTLGEAPAEVLVLAKTERKKAAKVRPAATKRKWKKATLEKAERAKKLTGGGTAAIPPTDCPPLPTQDCLDTWDEVAAP